MAHVTATLVSEFQSSGLTQKRFCAKKKISVSTLRYHLAKSRRLGGHSEKDSPATPARFIPLQVRNTFGGETTILVVRGSFERGELAELLQAVAE